MERLGSAVWEANWVWSLPLIVFCVVFHVLGLGFVTGRVIDALRPVRDRGHFLPKFVLGMSVTVLIATALHAIEGGLWAATYRILGALPDNKAAMLYSLSAMTSYGHANLFLADRWMMMGALEALNGMLLFGLTTACLFSTISQIWPRRSRDRRLSVW